MKHFAWKIFAITHGQWLVRNFTLHNNSTRYLLRKKEVALKITQLDNSDPAEVPGKSIFLLKTIWFTAQNRVVHSHQKQNDAQPKMGWCTTQNRAVHSPKQGGAQTKMRWCTTQNGVVQSPKQNGAQPKTEWCTAQKRMVHSAKLGGAKPKTGW